MIVGMLFVIGMMVFVLFGFWQTTEKTEPSSEQSIIWAAVVVVPVAAVIVFAAWTMLCFTFTLVTGLYPSKGWLTCTTIREMRRQTLSKIPDDHPIEVPFRTW